MPDGVGEAAWICTEAYNSSENEDRIASYWDSLNHTPIRAGLHRSVEIQRFGRSFSDTWRPDTIPTLWLACRFRGEEELVDQSKSQASALWQDGLGLWAYGDHVPYVFGYAAGYHCALYAIHCLDGTVVQPRNSMCTRLKM